MHSGMLVAVCIVFILNSMPGISASLFSSWFSQDSQSAMNKSGPGLYTILTLYWCILRRICCSLCDNVATSFLNIATSGFVFCNYTHLSHEAVMVELSDYTASCGCLEWTDHLQTSKIWWPSPLLKISTVKQLPTIYVQSREKQCTRSPECH